jgi:protein AFG1
MRRHSLHRLKKFQIIARNYSPSVPKSSTSESSKDGPIAIYQRKVQSGTIKEDLHQLKAIHLLQTVYDDITSDDANISHLASSSSPTAEKASKEAWFSSLNIFKYFKSDKSDDFRKVADSQQSQQSIATRHKGMGLYLWGGVGCGKTYIMDLFFESLPIRKKRRVHFNSFMIDVHKKLHQIKLSKDMSSNRELDSDHPISILTKELMNDSYVLCFDEFQVKTSISLFFPFISFSFTPFLITLLSGH